MSMTCRTRNNNEKTKTILITLPSLNWCDLMDTSTQLMIIIIIIRERLSAVNKINQWKKNMEKRCYKFNIIIFTRSCEWHTHKTIFLIKKMFSIRPKPNQKKKPGKISEKKELLLLLLMMLSFKFLLPKMMMMKKNLSIARDLHLSIEEKKK